LGVGSVVGRSYLAVHTRGEVPTRSDKRQLSDKIRIMYFPKISR